MFRLRPITNVIGILSLTQGLLMLVCYGISLHHRSPDSSGILIAAVVTMAFGGALQLYQKGTTQISKREGYLIVAVGWMSMVVFGMLPYLFTGVTSSGFDAFFESSSGFTTTGATIFRDIEALPTGVLFWRSLTHWLGGMGIIVLSLAILPTLGVGGMQLFKAEVPGPSLDKIRPRIQQTAKLLWGVYVLLTLVQAGLLRLGGMNLFDALCHTFGTMATGGFSTRNASMAAFPSAYLQTVVTVFMFLAGVNFTLHYKVLTGNWRAYSRDSELRLYFGISVISVLVIVANLVWSTETWRGRHVLDAAFQVVSFVRLNKCKSDFIRIY